MIEQQKYGEMLLKIIDQTYDEKLKTSEQLIQALINELKVSNKHLGVL